MRKYIDLEVYNKYGPDGYRELKSSAGKLGGRISKLPPETQKKNAAALNLSIHPPKTMVALCVKSINGYERGKKYQLTMRVEGNHPIIVSPITTRFDRWINFVDYFKRFKTK